MYEKRQKIEFSDLKYLLSSGIFLSGIGGYPPPPLTENHHAQKPLAEMGVSPPLNGQNQLSSFWRPSLLVSRDLFRCPSFDISGLSWQTIQFLEKESHITNDAIYLFPVVSKVMCSAVHKFVSQSVIMDLCYSSNLSHSWHLSLTQGFT